MTTPAISIITPVWNGLPYLKECIESVLIQDFQDWEMLISDDGSTDGSRDYLKTLNDPRIRVHFQTENQGIFDNLNSIFKRAGAPVSQILCQDDYFTGPQSLSTLFKYWEAAPDSVGFVRFNHGAEESSGLVALQKKALPSIVSYLESQLLFFVFGNIPGNLSNVSLRTNLVEQRGYFNQKLPYAGDIDFWSRASKVVDMGIENESIVFVRRHPGTASVFLNRKGELVAQLAEVVDRLYIQLLDEYPSAKFMLKLHGTLNYDILHRDTAFRLWLKRNPDYLRALEKVSKKAGYTIKGSGRWLLFFFTLGGRVGRPAVAKYLIRKIAQADPQIREQSEQLKISGHIK